VRAFNGPAGQAFLPLLVPQEHFPAAVAWGAAIFQAATILARWPAVLYTARGMVYMSLTDANGCHVNHRQFLGGRARVRAFAAQMALDMLRRRINLLL